MRRARVFVALLASAAWCAHAQAPSIVGCQVFPSDNYWNTPVDTLPVHPSSAAWVTTVGNTARLHADWGNVLADNYGIPFVTVNAAQPLVPVTGDPDPSVDYSDESDPGPYPIPPSAPIEGGSASTGDRHVLVIETSSCVLYELYNAHPVNGGASWTASSFAKWPLGSNALRPAGWTSADAAGLPIFPGLVRYDEAASGQINHAIRFTAQNIWGRDASGIKYLWPARHNSGTSTTSTRPPMGARFRLKSSYAIPATFNPATQAILRAMKKYGLVLADGGSNWFFQGVSDTRWSDNVFTELGTVTGSNFEVVDTSVMQVGPDSAQSVLPGSAANMTVSQVASPATGVTGKDLVLQVTVSNVSGSNAPSVVVQDVLPAGTAFVWASSGCSAAGTTVTCSAGTMAAGSNATYKIVVRPGTAGAFASMATVSVSGSAAASATLDTTVAAAPAANAVTRYRLYSPVTFEHHYTTDAFEYGYLGTVGWQQEGSIGHVLDNPGSFNGVVAVPYYRLYNTSARLHHWTTDPNEYYIVQTYPGWNAEGIDGFILPTQAAGTSPLYRLVLPGSAGPYHHWTTNPSENAVLIATYGWASEGISGYLIP